MSFILAQEQRENASLKDDGFQANSSYAEFLLPEIHQNVLTKLFGVLQEGPQKALRINSDVIWELKLGRLTYSKPWPRMRYLMLMG